MMDTSDQTTVKLTNGDLTEFDEKGFLTVKSPAVGELKESIRRVLKNIALKIIDRYKEGSAKEVELAVWAFADIVDWCVANEKDRRITRAFYEIFPATSEVITLVGHLLLNDIARQLGVGTPIPSTVPVLRIDRPGDVEYSTPPHQDYWFSMLSYNSIVYWIPINPLQVDMGFLQGIPGSHKKGMVPFKKWLHHEPFTTVEHFPDSHYIELPVEDDEMLVLSQLLIHRSGQNRSRKTRVTIQIRFNDLDTLKVMTSSFTPTHSQFVRERQEELLQGTQKPTIS